MAGGNARLQVNVSADASDAITAFKSVGDELKKLGGEAGDVTTQADKVAAAIAKMDKAKDSPAQLGKAVGLAKFQLEELERQLKSAGPAGEAAFKVLKEAIDKAEVSIKSMSTRAGQMKDAVADAGGASKTAATGMESLTGAVGSLEGMLGKLKEQGGATKERIASLGFGAIAVAQAFSFGYDMGKKFDEGLKSIGVDISNPSGMLGNFAGALGKTGVMGEAASKWLNEAGKSASAYGDLMGPLTGKVNSFLRVKQDLLQKLAEEDDALKKLVPGWLSVNEVLGQGSKGFEAISKRITDSLRDQKEWTNLIKVEGPVVGKVLQEMLAKGIIGYEQLTPAMKKFLAESELVGESLDRQSKKIKPLADSDLKALFDAFQKVGKAETDFGQGSKQSVQAQDELNLAMAKVRTETTKTTQEILDAIGKYKGQQQVIREIAKGDYPDFIKSTQGAISVTDKFGDSAKGLGGGFKGVTEGIKPAAAATREWKSESNQLTTEMTKSGSALDANTKSTITYKGRTIETTVAVKDAKTSATELKEAIDKEKEAKDRAIAIGEKYIEQDRQAAKAKRDLAKAAKELETQLFTLAEAADRAMTPIMGMGVSAIQTATAWSSMAVAGKQLESNMQPIQGMWLKITEATDAQTASLKEMLAANNALSESQAKLLDTATGWRDVLVQIKEGYDSGVTSLTVYLESLNSFRTQLETLFAGASGSARKSIEEMIDMITKLIAVAGQSPTRTKTGSYALDNLNQSLGGA